MVLEGPRHLGQNVDVCTVIGLRFPNRASQKKIKKWNYKKYFFGFSSDCIMLPGWRAKSARITYKYWILQSGTYHAICIDTRPLWN